MQRHVTCLYQGRARDAVSFSRTGEALKPVLVPGSWLLEPVADGMADWPGFINVIVGSVANGLVYVAVAAAVAT